MKKNKLLISLFALTILSPVYGQPQWQLVKNNFDVRQIISDTKGTLFFINPSYMFFSNDFGATWDSSLVNSQSDFSSIGFDPQSGYIFVTVEAGAFRSNNNGENWEQLSDSLTGSYSFAIDSAGRLFLSGSQGVFRSVDHGENWQKLGDINAIFTNGILCLPQNRIFVTTVISKLFKSENNGDTWIQIPDFTDIGHIRSLAYNSLTATIFAAYQIATNTYSEARIYRSTDNGESWQYTTLDNYSVNGIFVDNQGIIYVASQNEVLVSYDNGLTFHILENTFETDNDVNCSYKINSTLFVGTAHGLYKLNNNSTFINQIVNLDNYRIQNYPNPFNESTIISFEIPENENVNMAKAELIIYNVYGKVVSILDSGNIHKGKNEIFFDASKLSDGVYFFSLKLPNNLFTAKMIKFSKK